MNATDTHANTIRGVRATSLAIAIVTVLACGQASTEGTVSPTGEAPSSPTEPPAVGEGSLRLVQTIPLPGVAGRIDHLAVDLAGKRLFVAALGNNTVEVV